MTRKLAWTVGLTAVSAAATVLALVGTRPDAHAQDAIELKIATVAPEGTPWEKQLRNFKRYVEEGSQGRVKVKMFMGGALGGEKALVRRTQQGSLQCFAGSTGALGTAVAELNVIEAPYLFSSFEQADRALDSQAVRTAVASAVQRAGFQFGFWAENGFRSWFTKERPIRLPADMRGLRMRSQEALVHLETYRAVGASPVPIDVTNVLTSLQTGVVDGFDNSLLFAFAASWYQGARQLNVSQHSYQPGIVVYSKSWFDGLPADVKRILTEVPTAMVTDGRAAVRRMEPILLRNLERYGIQVHQPTPEERAQFVQATRQVADRVAGKSGRGGRELLRALRAGAAGG
ncbi:MAG: TRAP transporter substrate-binding protein [Myxococcota bacterium]|nr:TRAP transporter substrate-binding protein [Myxococcota bacterium]MDW8360775.1 TRAP transporter substrate-binding protein [Myxococcales bacterium]